MTGAPHPLVPGPGAAPADTGVPAALPPDALAGAVPAPAAGHRPAPAAPFAAPAAQATADSGSDSGPGPDSAGAQAPQAGAPDSAPGADSAATQTAQSADSAAAAAAAAQASGKAARKTPGGHGPGWDPDKAPEISAARAAADFVAQIFADVHAPESVATAAATPADPQADAAPLAEPIEPAQAAPASDRSVRSDLSALLQGRNILILGLGASGLAMARWCQRCGAQQVTVADTRAAPPQLAALRHAVPQAQFVCSALEAGLLEGRELHALYRSPGLSPAHIAPVLLAAQAAHIGTGGELDLFTMALAELRAAQGYAPTLLAVTGTNGKTTVTALTGQLVARAGKSVAVAGNIGPTLLDTLAAQLDAGRLPEVWVLELSSFQLDCAGAWEPDAAALLNLTQDHLDWHGAMPAYAAAKARIFGQTGLALLNREDPALLQLLAPAPAAQAQPGARTKAAASAQNPRPRDYLSFGADAPRRAGDFGIATVAAMPWLVRALALDETRKPAPRRRAAAGAAAADQAGEEELYIQRLMPAEALQIRGRHNAVNALAALALASCAGCALAPMLHGLRAYRGEPHRLQAVALIDGVEYFDDSKGTNVGATVAALTGLGAERRLLVILGGDGKGQDFAPLAAPLARHARAAILIGRDAPLLRAALEHTPVALYDAQSLPDAVACAAAQAQAGDAVLLSPACASFDMFRDYEQRAQVFCASVHALADRTRQQPPEGAQ